MIASFLMKMVPPWIVGVLVIRWWMTFDPATLAALGLAAVVELFLWFQRLARDEKARLLAQGYIGQGRLERMLLSHPLAVVAGLVVFGVLIDLGRAVYAVGAFWWWLVGAPAVLVNRQRYARAQAVRQAAIAQRIIEAGSDPAQVVAGGTMKARALNAAQQHLGLGPGHDALPARRQPVLEAEPNRRSEHLEIAASPVAVTEAEIANVAIVHGLVQTYADGSHRFDPMAVEPVDGAR